MSLFPEIEPFDSGVLNVSSIHTIYYEQSGNLKGKPVIYLHGGPGGGTSPRDRRFFDPVAYRIILMDQRGAGKSTPAAELEDNSSQSLVSDIEKLRIHLKIEQWLVFGGSWGSTLSIYYAESHPSRVIALILRGIFTLRKEEINWFYQEGASFLFPDHFEEFESIIPLVERHNLLYAYHRRLTGHDKELALKCARAWSKWEMATSRLFVDNELLKRVENDEWTLQFARIETHYFINGGFFDTSQHLLENVDKIRHIPTTIVQGRYDIVCPIRTAWDLHKKFPEAEFFIVPDAGHSAREDGIVKRLIEATEKYKKL